jgi:hypothetical protein
MFIIVLGLHVSILIESSSGTSKKIDPYLKCLKMRCGIPNGHILHKTMYNLRLSFVVIVQSGYLILKLLVVHMKEVTRIYIVVSYKICI